MQLLLQTLASPSQRPSIFLINRRSVLVFCSLRPTEPDHCWEGRRKGPRRQAFLNSTLTPPPESTRVHRRQPWREGPAKAARCSLRLDWMRHEHYLLCPSSQRSSEVVPSPRPRSAYGGSQAPQTERPL